MSNVATPISGLIYKALDLHVHSPASQDFKRKNVSPGEIVKAAIDAGLAGICLTDHNTAEWVDGLTAAAKGTQLTVFPGVEISVTGGKEGPVHIIGIFHPGRSAEDIHDLLSQLELTSSKRGKTDELAKGSPNDVIDAIAGHGGLPILAHADSSHGVLHDMKGQPRIKVVQNPNLRAAEVSKEKYRKALDGTDKHYKRRLATYTASDAHALEHIGRKRAFFKTGKLSLEGLRQCFLDPDVRIRSEDEYDDLQLRAFPCIINISVQGGFFDKETLSFHSCHNSIIGGQGVGKSLLVELLRFCLHQVSPVDAIAADNDRKLATQLGLGGEASVQVELANGTRYGITREYDGRSNPIIAVNLETGETYEGDLPPLFPIMAYSQTEAVHIARHPAAQLELIDRFIDAASFERRLRNVQRDLVKNGQELAGLLEARERLTQLETELKTIDEELRNTEKSLKNPVFTSMKRADSQKDAFEALVEYHEELASYLNVVVDELGVDYGVPSITGIPKADKLSQAHRIALESLRSVQDYQERARSVVQKNKTRVKDNLSEWDQSQYDRVSKKYRTFLKKAGGDQKALEAQRKKTAVKKKRLEREIKTLRSKTRRLNEVMTSRASLLDQFDDIVRELSDVRKDKYEDLTVKSAGKIELELRPLADRSAFATKLKEIATGTKIRKSDLDVIAERIQPRGFVDGILNNDVAGLVSQTGLDQRTIEKLIAWLTNLEDQRVVLSLQHECVPHDIPSIRFRKDDGKYYEIADVSVGQKCTALLIIALCADDQPIIIDQPEESIDIASVFSDIVTKLRIGKDSRQFILTTHNPNIAVTADSDLIHILKSSATRGKIVNRGVIEDEEVRSDVIEHLEGGKDPYLVRGKKYGIL